MRRDSCGGKRGIQVIRLFFWYRKEQRLVGSRGDSSYGHGYGYVSALHEYLIKKCVSIVPVSLNYPLLLTL